MTKAVSVLPFQLVSRLVSSTGRVRDVYPGLITNNKRDCGDIYNWLDTPVFPDKDDKLRANNLIAFV